MAGMEDDRPKCPWLRFSLRMLLIMFTFSAIARWLFARSNGFRIRAMEHHWLAVEADEQADIFPPGDTCNRWMAIGNHHYKLEDKYIQASWRPWLPLPPDPPEPLRPGAF